MVQSTLNAVTKERSVFPKPGSAMVIEIVWTIQTKQTALRWCRHVARENSSVKMVRVFISAGVVMAIQTAVTIQTSSIAQLLAPVLLGDVTVASSSVIQTDVSRDLNTVTAKLTAKMNQTRKHAVRSLM